ncbi:MAG TPA: hypothetical protein VFS92_11295, partial [Planctomycetota bacterium]|nr:hypothetical protein [Planctomycetota bacterium]
MIGARTRGSFAALLFAIAALAAPAAPDEDEKEFFRKEVVVFEEFARSHPRGTELRLKCALARGYAAPMLVVVFPDGDAKYLRPEKSSGRDHEFLLRMDKRGGRHRVTFVADSHAGVLYGARFHLMATGPDGKPVDRDVDVPPDDADYAPVDPEEDPLRLERVLFHRMNAFRSKLGKAPLPWHEGVARAAREVIPGIARHYEETIRADTGRGNVVHRVPFIGEDGGDGPTIADRCVALLGWKTAKPWLAPEAPSRHLPNFVTESLTDPSWSLDSRFETKFLLKSDFRAPMCSDHLTHAAGAVSWRWYGWKRGGTATQPGPAPKGKPREVLAALVFVQVNEVKAEAGLRKEKAEADAALGRAKSDAERGEALRGIGRYAFPDAPPRLEDALSAARSPEARAGALDGLWLSAPGAARRLSEPFLLRIEQSLEEKQEGRAAEAIAALSLVRWDAASRRAALRAAAAAAAFRALAPAAPVDSFSLG